MATGRPPRFYATSRDRDATGGTAIALILCRVKTHHESDNARGEVPHSSPVLAWAVVIVFLLAIFDLGRVAYTSARLQWAVDHFIAAAPAASRQVLVAQSIRQGATERIRRLSGIADLASDSVSIRSDASRGTDIRHRKPARTRVTVTATYPVGLISPYARAYFGERGLAVGASETFELASADLSDY